MSKVAVLVLSYNDAATIAESVGSLVNQQRCNELAAVLLADDASHDETIVRARSAAGNAVTLDVLPTPQNLGPWPNLNRSLRYAATVADWAFILHADDIAMDGWLDALLTRVERCNDDVASISTSWDMLFGDAVVATGERHDDEVRIISGSREAVHDTLLSGCWWKISGAAVRTKAFLDIGDFDSTVPQCADWDWTMRALDRGWSIEYIPRVFTLYRQHAATMSTAALQSDVDIEDALTMVDRFGHVLRKRELVGYHAKRGGYALRRLARGLIKADVRRVGVSLRSIVMLGGDLVKRLAA